jgi:hypothetical protein
MTVNALMLRSHTVGSWSPHLQDRGQGPNKALRPANCTHSRKPFCADIEASVFVRLRVAWRLTATSRAERRVLPEQSDRRGGRRGITKSLICR